MPGHGYFIRLAKPGDEVGIAIAHVQPWQETYSGLLPQSFLDSLSVDKRRDMSARVINRNTEVGARDGRFFKGSHMHSEARDLNR